MNGKVHYWIVCDAVQYIKNHGNSFEKKALQTLQNAYGPDIPVQNIPYYDGAVQKTAGIESRNTDRYHDLAMYLESLLGGWKDNITEYDGHVFTALNHFINAFIVSPVMWSGNNGYFYFWSSKKGDDAKAMTGWVDYLDAEVDDENSLVLNRIKSYWEKGDWSWGENFEWDIRSTMFAPVSALAYFYYTRFALNHHTPLRVNGPNKYIAGLRLLGPVLHAIADACVPQHVRPALGFYHQTWENLVESNVYDWKIDLDANLVKQILSQHPFTPWYTYMGGPLKDKFAVGWVVKQVANKTRDRLAWRTGKSYSQLWNASEWEWFTYLFSTFHDDAKYLYNFAIAGTVHVIVRAYNDLVKEGILSSNPGIVHPERMPDLDIIEFDLKDLPKKRPEEGGIPPEKLKHIPFSKPRDLLGFEPVGDEEFKSRLMSANRLFAVDTTEELEPEMMSQVLRDIEESLGSQYLEMEKKHGAKFCPLRAMEKLSFDYDLSACFGMGTFRLPSSKERDNPELFQQYSNQLDVHVYKAYLFGLTRVIASLEFYTRKLKAEEETASRIRELTAKIEELREKAIVDRKIPVVAAGKSKVEQFEVSDHPEVPQPENIAAKPPKTE